MIKHLIDALQYANGETEYIRIAQGKNKLPMKLGDALKRIKTETKWQNKER